MVYNCQFVFSGSSLVFWSNCQKSLFTVCVFESVCVFVCVCGSSVRARSNRFVLLLAGSPGIFSEVERMEHQVSYFI